MGVSPEQARRLTYWEYTALRHGWNERHKAEGDEGGEPAEHPTAEFVRQRQAELFEVGIAGTTLQ